MEVIGGVIVLTIAFAILAAIFLVFRFLILWYWRVNESVELLTSINQKLGRILDRVPDPDAVTNRAPFSS